MFTTLPCPSSKVYIISYALNVKGSAWQNHLYPDIKESRVCVDTIFFCFSLISLCPSRSPDRRSPCITLVYCWPPNCANMTCRCTAETRSASFAPPTAPRANGWPGIRRTSVRRPWWKSAPTLRVFNTLSSYTYSSVIFLRNHTGAGDTGRVGGNWQMTKLVEHWVNQLPPSIPSPSN